MKHTDFPFAAFAAAMLCLAGTGLPGAEPGQRTVHLKMDDAQIHFESKLYQLKYAKSEEILPFVNSAIQRYNQNSTVKRVTGGANAGEALLVTTGRSFLPYVDQIIAALDYPGGKDAVINGTGVSRIAYTPRYRAAKEFAGLIDSTVSSKVGKTYVNQETNTIFWRDQAESAKNTLRWIEALDRPLPQVRIRINYYELRDSDLKDWGFDYLAWKNGPGVNLLNLGYNAGHIAIDELLSNIQYVASASWGFGGFFTAPQFDMSFIRCLQQSSSASLAANATLTMVNTPICTSEDYVRLLQMQKKDPKKSPFLYRISLTPEYQNVTKNVLGRSVIGKSFYEDEDGEKHSDPPLLDAIICNPTICLPDGTFQTFDEKNLPQGGVLFQYSLDFKNVIERGNTGQELSNSAAFSGAATLAFGGEKVLTVYEKENDVEQTIGIPVLCRIPVIKYLFSTVTTIKERTYIVITAEAQPADPAETIDHPFSSESTNVKRRIENPFRKSQE